MVQITQKYFLQFKMTVTKNTTSHGGGRLSRDKWGDTWQSKYEDRWDTTELVYEIKDPTYHLNDEGEEKFIRPTEFIINEIPKVTKEHFGPDAFNFEGHHSGLKTTTIWIEFDAVMEVPFTCKEDVSMKLRINGINNWKQFTYWEFNGYEEPNTIDKYSLERMVSWKNFLYVVETTDDTYKVIHSCYDDDRWIELLGLSDGTLFGHAGSPRRDDYYIGHTPQLIEEKLEVVEEYNNGLFDFIKL